MIILDIGKEHNMSFDRKHNAIINFISTMKDFDSSSNTFTIRQCYPNGKPIRLKLVRTSEALYISDNGECAAYIMQELLSSNSAVALQLTKNILKELTRRTPISASEAELRSNVTYFNTRKDLENEISYFENAYAAFFAAQCGMLGSLKEMQTAEKAQTTASHTQNCEFTLLNAA